jgi:hypothetical protein
MEKPMLRKSSRRLEGIILKFFLKSLRGTMEELIP